MENVSIIEELIGREFKRNVYGPSLWTDTVQRVRVVWEIPGTWREYKGFQRATIMVEGSKHWFPLDEVLFVRPLDKGQIITWKIEERHAELIKKIIDGKT